MDTVLPQDRLDAYRVSLELVTLSANVIKTLPTGSSDIADQLKRSSASVTLNIAGGGGEFSPREKSRFYRMALRSAAETGGAFDILRCRGEIEDAQHLRGRHLASRLVAMLTKLVHRGERTNRDWPDSRRSCS